MLRHTVMKRQKKEIMSSEKIKSTLCLQVSYGCGATCPVNHHRVCLVRLIFEKMLDQFASGKAKMTNTRREERLSIFHVEAST